MKLKNTSEAIEFLLTQRSHREDAHGIVSYGIDDFTMHFKCNCGYQSAMIANFTKYIECEKCNRTYFMNPMIELIELEDKPNSLLRK